jgi:hypothetical protein
VLDSLPLLKLEGIMHDNWSTNPYMVMIYED